MDTTRLEVVRIIDRKISIILAIIDLIIETVYLSIHKNIWKICSHVWMLSKFALLISNSIFWNESTLKMHDLIELVLKTNKTGIFYFLILNVLLHVICKFTTLSYIISSNISFPDGEDKRDYLQPTSHKIDLPMFEMIWVIAWTEQSCLELPHMPTKSQMMNQNL